MAKKDKKRVSKRKRRKRAILTFFVLVAVSLLCGLSFTVFFPVKNIEVLNNSIYNTQEIINASLINNGDNLLRLSEKRVLENLQESLPFVDGIVLEKKLPDTVIIEVTEATEYCCYNIDGIYYSTDINGRVLKEYYEIPSLVYVECKASLSKDNIRSVVLESDNHKNVLNEILNSGKLDNTKLNYIDISNLYDIKIGIDNRFTIELGEDRYINEKLALFSKMAESKTQENSGVFRFNMWEPNNPQGSYVENKR
ncbi:MAG: FtsQ-type POTRA domain-containing protein [Acutalibacteraceae bacterium]|nr:FtsQ-type POTRA domain-containing protein [Acutalibacteraceae bacterium]